MSYILEALRRAERERNPTQPESPRAELRARFPQISNLQQLRPYRPALVAGLCLGLMIAVTITLIRRPHTTVSKVVPAPAALAPVATAPTNDPYSALLKQVYGDGNGPATLDDLVDSGDDAVADDAPAYIDPDTSSHLREAATPAISDDPTDASAVVPTSPVVAPTVAPAPTPAPERPAPVTKVEHMQLDPAPPPQVPRLGDMSVDYRAAFPTITLDVHSYDSAQKKRFIMINGKRFNEGDTLPEGPRIVQIVPDGVVFDFRGEHVLFPIAH